MKPSSTRCWLASSGEEEAAQPFPERKEQIRRALAQAAEQPPGEQGEPD